MTINWTVYTDGACRPNPGYGGYAVIIENEGLEQPLILSGSKRVATNQEMELLAIVDALHTITTLVDPDADYLDNVVTVISDNEWAIKCLNGQYKRCTKYPTWRNTAKKYMERFVVHFEHIYSHQKVETHAQAMNQLCDSLAKQAAEAVQEDGIEKGWWTKKGKL